MGEEFGAATPFLFFCNFEKGLAEAVSAGRRNEFARFTHFGDAASGESIPDPNAESTFERSKLDWEDISQPSGKEWLALHRNLLRIRREFISPRSLGDCRTQAKYEVLNNQGLQVQWNFSDGAQLTLLVNLSPSALSDFPLPSGETIYFSKGVLPDGEDGTGQSSSSLPSWSVRWALES
jgi:1,4-alpha-glucan branching enzyme